MPAILEHISAVLYDEAGAGKLSCCVSFATPAVPSESWMRILTQDLTHRDFLVRAAVVRHMEGDVWVTSFALDWSHIPCPPCDDD